jgi:hypothetical protein
VPQRPDDPYGRALLAGFFLLAALALLVFGLAHAGV